MISQKEHEIIEAATKPLISKTEIATLLKISRPTLYRKLRENDFTKSEVKKLKKHGILA